MRLAQAWAPTFELLGHLGGGKGLRDFVSIFCGADRPRDETTGFPLWSSSAVGIIHYLAHCTGIDRPVVMRLDTQLLVAYAYFMWAGPPYSACFPMSDESLTQILRASGVTSEDEIMVRLAEFKGVAFGPGGPDSR